MEWLDGWMSLTEHAYIGQPNVGVIITRPAPVKSTLADDTNPLSLIDRTMMMHRRTKRRRVRKVKHSFRLITTNTNTDTNTQRTNERTNAQSTAISGCRLAHSSLNHLPNGESLPHFVIPSLINPPHFPTDHCRSFLLHRFLVRAKQFQLQTNASQSQLRDVRQQRPYLEMGEIERDRDTENKQRER
eukprot:GHVU01210998.1.p1 GENE.GHVU01210998.1~~GHVU01210998.1.p1  ORF type:complete len:187 (-),score=21.09 GHVU01210998.1:505-1065(-)